MAKKGIKYYIPGAIALVLGIAAFCMMFLTAVTYSADLLITDVSYSYTGMQLAFGYSETVGEGSLSASTTILNFNFMMFAAFVLPVIGGFLALIFKNGLITKIVTTGCFVAGAVMLFTIVASLDVGFLSTESEGFNNQLQQLYDLIKENFVLGAGAIAGGVLSIVGAVVCFFKGTIAKIFSK